MQNLQHRIGVEYQLAKTRATDLANRAVEDEEGEIGSWLILAAGLAIAAGAAVAALTPWLQGKVTDITGQ